MSRSRRLVLAAVLGLGVVAALAQDGRAETPPGPVRQRVARPAPYNVVVVILDTSESFQRPSRQPGVEGKVLLAEALKVLHRLLDEAARQKRRRTDGTDQYFLVAADAASQVIWSGIREELAHLTPEILATKLAVRKQFAGCTDLEAALNEAAAILGEHPGAAESYVLTFSDLLHEPPRGSYSRCALPSGEPPAGIRWEDLAEASLGFYFVSKDFPHRPDQKWRAELARRGLAARFLDAAQTLTADVSLTPPAPARYRPTAAEAETARTKLTHLKGWLSTAVWYGAACVAAAMATMIGGILLRRRTARSAEADRA
jgi:hypothetical protein